MVSSVSAGPPSDGTGGATAARGDDDGVHGPQTSAVTAELADVAILLTYLAHDLGIDLDQAVRDKLAVNAQR